MQAPSMLSHCRTVTPYAGIGLAGIVGGGLVAAAIAHDPTETGTWAIAYLVLIVGVAQLALGIG